MDKEMTEAIPEPEEFLKNRRRTNINGECCTVGAFPTELLEKVNRSLLSPQRNGKGLADWLRLYYPTNYVSSTTLLNHVRHINS